MFTIHNFQISKDVEKSIRFRIYCSDFREVYIFSMKLYVYRLKIRVDSNKRLVTKHKMEKGSRIPRCVFLFIFFNHLIR